MQRRQDKREVRRAGVTSDTDPRPIWLARRRVEELCQRREVAVAAGLTEVRQQRTEPANDRVWGVDARLVRRVIPGVAAAVAREVHQPALVLALCAAVVRPRRAGRAGYHDHSEARRRRLPSLLLMTHASAAPCLAAATAVECLAGRPPARPPPLCRARQEANFEAIEAELLQFFPNLPEEGQRTYNEAGYKTVAKNDLNIISLAFFTNRTTNFF